MKKSLKFYVRMIDESSKNMPNWAMWNRAY